MVAARLSFKIKEGLKVLSLLFMYFGYCFGAKRNCFLSTKSIILSIAINKYNYVLIT